MKLLIIDDDRSFCEVLTELLASKGHETLLAHSAAEGLKLAGTEGLDCILLDWVLPEGRGQDFIEGLRRGSQQTPIVMISAMQDMHNVVSAVKAGAYNFLYKPFKPEELEAAIEDAAASRRDTEDAGSGPEDEGLPRTERAMRIRLFREALVRHAGNKSNAARELGITRQTLAKWLRAPDTEEEASA